MRRCCRFEPELGSCPPIFYAHRNVTARCEASIGCSAFGGIGGTPGVRSGAFTPTRSVAVGQLRYREDTLGIAFRPLLAGHCGEQTQIVTLDGEAATPRLEIADCAMPVQDEWGRFPTVAGRLDRGDGLARPSDVVPDLHSSAAVAIAVNQRSSVWQYPGPLRK